MAASFVDILLDSDFEPIKPKKIEVIKYIKQIKRQSQIENTYKTIKNKFFGKINGKEEINIK